MRNGHLAKYTEILAAAGFVTRSLLPSVSGYSKGKHTVYLTSNGWVLTESQWQCASGSHYKSLPDALKDLT